MICYMSTYQTTLVKIGLQTRNTLKNLKKRKKNIKEVILIFSQKEDCAIYKLQMRNFHSFITNNQASCKSSIHASLKQPPKHIHNQIK